MNFQILQKTHDSRQIPHLVFVFKDFLLISARIFALDIQMLLSKERGVLCSGDMLSDKYARYLLHRSPLKSSYHFPHAVRLLHLGEGLVRNRPSHRYQQDGFPLGSTQHENLRAKDGCRPIGSSRKRDLELGEHGIVRAREMYKQHEQM